MPRVLSLLLLFSIFRCSENESSDRGKSASDSQPVISNLSVRYDPSSRELLVSYDVSDSLHPEVDIYIRCKVDKGSLPIDDNLWKGDFGKGITVGPAKTATCKLDPSIEFNGKVYVTILASNHSSPAVSMRSPDTVGLRRSLESLFGVRHASNPEHYDHVRDFIKEALIQYGYDVTSQPFVLKTVNGENIIARKQGLADPQKTVLVCAHYDTTPNSPGADDNASGVAVLLEVARLLSQVSTSATVELVALDLEEYGLAGSKEYISKMVTPERKDDLVAINLDMVGYTSAENGSQKIPEEIALAFPSVVQRVEGNGSRGNFIVCIANDRSKQMKDDFEELGNELTPSRGIVSLVLPGNGEIFSQLRYGDHTSFWDAGFKAIFIGDGADTRNARYHSPYDTLGTIDYRFAGDIASITFREVVRYAGLTNSSAATQSLRLEVERLAQ